MYTNVKRKYKCTDLKFTSVKSSGMECCTYDCTQGRDCPIRSLEKNMPSFENINRLKNLNSLILNNFSTERLLNILILIITYLLTISGTYFNFKFISIYTFIIGSMGVYVFMIPIKSKN